MKSSANSDIRTAETSFQSGNIENLDGPESDVPNGPRPLEASHGLSGREKPNRATIEETLAAALEGAATAGRWDVVAQLAKELEARRLAASGNVVALNPKEKRT